MKELLKKLHAAKSEIGKISKDSTNPFFKSKYFDINQLLETVEPILHKNGLVVLQPIQDNAVKSIIYEIESGESIESEMKLSEISDPQKRGSEITYFRRYTLQSLLSLQAEDDDANTAATASKPQQSNQSEPDTWLNLFDKQGNKTEKYAEIEKALSDGKSFTLAGIRKKYKVSKQVASELESNFNIK
jgi:hypothetical protein